MKKALVVGINEYPKIPLSGCINDARDIARILEKNENGSRNFDVILKENIKTKGELLSLIDSLFKGKSLIQI